jgi:hypothetical protein
MKRISIIYALIAFSNTSANAENKQFESALKCLLSDKMEVIQTKAGLDSKLSLKNMAEKNGRYNKTDVISGDDEKYPSRQFIVGGRCNDYLFVAYNYGGRGSGQKLDFYRIQNSQQRVIARYWLREEISDFQSLKDVIKSGKADLLKDRQR